MDPNNATIATNRSARHNYVIEDELECGLVLRGSEVKSLREAHVQIADSFAQYSGGELWVHNLHIGAYSHAAGVGSHQPLRVRKLLAHRREIERLRKKMQTERIALVPLRLYFKDGRVKLLLGIGRGRSKSDKRQAIAEREATAEARREIGRALKHHEQA